MAWAESVAWIPKFWTCVRSLLRPQDVVALSLVSKVFQIYKVKLDWSRVDDSFIEYWLTNRVILAVNKSKLEMIPLTYVGNSWEQNLYITLTTLVPDLATELKLELPIRCNKEYVELRDVVYTVKQSKRMLADYAELCVNWYRTGWAKVAEVIESKRSKYVNVEQVRRKVVANIRARAESFKVEVTEKDWIEMKSKHMGSVSGIRLCVVCGRQTRNFSGDKWICKDAHWGSRVPGLRRALEISGMNYIEEFPVKVGRGIKKVDFYFPGEERDVLLECDEGAHGSKSKRDELERMLKIAEAFSGVNVCFIRYNSEHKEPDEVKWLRLITWIRVLLSQPPKYRAEVVELYY